jgi:hypothetical protein
MSHNWDRDVIANLQELLPATLAQYAHIMTELALNVHNEFAQILPLLDEPHLPTASTDLYTTHILA